MNQKGKDRLVDIIGDLNELLVEEEDKIDNCPEGLEDSEIYIDIQMCVEEISSAIEYLEEVL